ncbi:MAG: enoyl-CoA hydratase/isomerase family protein [Chloroflexia bacterium]|nr:enoyl-CoA hydratase/isomerase family protein [Chloroflexia bacterium]
MDAPPASANFSVERDGRKAVLTFTREERLNALDAETFRDLLTALDALEADRGVGVVIMTGRGRAFVAGADITGYVDRTVTEYVAFQRLGRLVFDRIERLRQPVIAAVNGFALGGGFELVLAADLVVAADDAKLGLPEAKLGLLPGGGGTQRLPRLVGRNRAKELLMTADFISAEEARQLGIVNRVVPAAELMTAAHALADRILKRAPLAVEMAKQLVNDGLDASLPAAITQEMGMTATLYATDDAREGIAAFVEKRPATFAGR